MRYYFAVYETRNDERIAQLCTNEQDINSDKLDDPGVITLHEGSQGKAVAKAKTLAKEHGCGTMYAKIGHLRSQAVRL